MCHISRLVYGRNTCLHVQARHCNLPANTPLVEQVRPEVDAGVPMTPMQVAAAKYRRQMAPAKEAASKPAVNEADLPTPQYPKPKMRDEFLHFPVMPGATRLHAARSLAAVRCSAGCHVKRRHAVRVPPTKNVTKSFNT
jgi:hypothetical protein